MRLKTLQIKGFKSFADNTVLNFNEDVIGVVGPNGSGKSNIVDAIRWVLGEQKKRELRLESMGDVIFNGTKTRKKGGVAQVTLTFENTKNLLPTEYQEVSVSRLIYQSGDTEYRLNNVPCRLKDITTLLMDTGVGSNSYAIIALGMVDDILSDKENARRKMFEQAAGISKYKRRKHETLNKLKITAGDLERVDDLLFELQKNMSSLERQAKRTERFYALKKSYQDKSVHAAFMNIDAFQIQKAELDTKIQKEILEYEKITAEQNTKESALQKIKKDNLSQEQNLSGFQEEVNKMINEIRNLEFDKKSSLEKIAYNNSRSDELIQGISSAKQNIALLTKECDEIEAELNVVKSEVAKVSNEYEEANSLYLKTREDYDKIRDEFDVATRERQEGERILNEAEKDKAVLESRLSILTQDLGFLENTFNEFASSQQELQGRLSTVESNLNEQQLELEKLQLSKSVATKKRHELIEQKETQEKDLAKVNRSIDAKVHQRDLLQNMIDNLEGYPESIKFLNDKWNSKVPVLADILNVNEDLRGIVEQYLEPYLNYFIVENIYEASDAIKLLSTAQKGKANFFLLDQIEYKASSTSAKHNASHVNNYIDIDNKYQRLTNFLLHNVFIYDGDINELDNSNGGVDHVFLSKAGNFIKNKFSVSGGSKGLFEGSKIGRKKSLADLKEKIKSEERYLKEIETKLEGVESQLEELAKESYEEAIEELKSNIELINLSKTEINTKLSSINEQVETQSTKRNSINANKASILSNITAKTGIISEITNKLQEANNGGGVPETDLSQFSEQLSASSAKVNEIRIELIRQENKLEGLTKDFEYRTNRINELKLIETKNSEQSKTMLNEVQELTSSSNDMELRLQDLYIIQKEKQSELSEVEQSYFKEKSGIHEKEDEIRELNRKITNANSLINELKEKATSLRFEIKTVDERLKTEFNVSLDDVKKDELDLTIDLEVLNEDVAKLKHRLAGYGEINPLALEAYDEIKIRYDEMNQQREDILAAKESLLETIQEIEDTASLKFMTAFDQVRTNFKEVFRSLFSDEDDCDLVLLSDSTPMDAKIEIIAKPKGKRPKTISQLSGGEKTLTATALLFALYLLKPAPFCVFDEVDAPLDDSNVHKFNKIINKFSKQSQFIVVTHNKLTMAEMDVIYGVYMQEQGVSGVSPVDLRNYEHQPYFETVA